MCLSETIDTSMFVKLKFYVDGLELETSIIEVYVVR